ncbi:NAD(P)-dependent dehydrogenase (short-subunit alcohol dehydrogenase family) [Pedobacter cryoconitis]|uniref:NAD(P)-dependent dehydrogenase (Short-subunit alcohol dehydrogenase family) n=1 Tax=Pedobacter cryoconitis TaxID=188932 RepID=A0A7W9DMS5_9SPHI|nr:SDR family oxidoreductase [Pedobacter cryoconitis]MBB5623470.1 NAD(P)-dependent dehydrogenase (short-subunit alcohol dehydrogenase family) [Pedobacter cryoconitis]
MEQIATGKEVLQGQKIVIIGGSAGIGLATAKSAAAKNATVIIISSNQQRINKALEELPESATGYAIDVTDEAQVKSIFEKIGFFDHLIFTAGEHLQLGDLKDTSLASAHQFFEIRYWGAFTAVKHASPYIRNSIVLTSGIASNRPGKGWSLGASICSAMEGFTRAMAIELAPIRVNIVSPGVVKTDLWSGMSLQEREGMYNQIGDSLPVKRVGNADDIAKTYLYLMKQEYGTGQTIIVDGGASLV